MLGLYFNPDNHIWLEANNALPLLEPITNACPIWLTATRDFYVVNQQCHTPISVTGAWTHVRTAFSLLPSQHGVMLAHAIQFNFFDRQALFCQSCAGKLSASSTLPISKQCTGCARTVYPNINPAIIVAIYCKSSKQLLLQQPLRQPAVSFYSAVAGFVELGETLEQAAAREVQEEIGVRIKNVRYQFSQSWPVGSALMLGFIAEYDSGDIVIDPIEVVDAQFFDYDNLPEIPPPNTIAHQLIEVICQQLQQEAT